MTHLAAQVVPAGCPWLTQDLRKWHVALVLLDVNFPIPPITLDVSTWSSDVLQSVYRLLSRTEWIFQSLVIVAELIAQFVTWYKTAGIITMIRELKLSSTLSVLLLRDGKFETSGQKPLRSYKNRFLRANSQPPALFRFSRIPVREST